MSDEKEIPIFTSLSLVQDSWHFMRQNAEAIVLIIALPLLFEVSASYLQYTFDTSPPQTMQGSEPQTFMIPSVSSLTISLINVYLLGGVYWAIQRLFFLNEAPVFPQFLTSLGARQSAICLLANYVLMAFLMMIAVAPAYLASWANEVYPEQFWTMGFGIVSGLASLVMVWLVFGCMVRLLFSMPARCLNTTTALKDIFTLANKIGRGHVKSLLGPIVILSLIMGMLSVFLASVFANSMIVTLGFMGALSWFYAVLLIVMYSVAFQAIYKHQAETNEVAKP